MKKILCIISMFCISLMADSKNDCNLLLKEGDKYLQRVPLCDELAEKHSKIAMAYYERYKICKYYRATEDITSLFPYINEKEKTNEKTYKFNDNKKD